jgi:hypothetical protein
MTSTHRGYQPFINYLQNKITTPQLHFEDLEVRDETVILELNYEGDLAPRDEQKQVREVIPEYFLMAQTTCCSSSSRNGSSRWNPRRINRVGRNSKVGFWIKSPIHTERNRKSKIYDGYEFG